jgi:hypothetical protein
LEKTPEETIVFPQKSIGKLEKNPKVKSGNRGKLEMRKVQKKQSPEPTPQSSKVEMKSV